MTQAVTKKSSSDLAASKVAPDTTLQILPNVVEDPILNFISSQWKNVLIIVAAVLAVTYGRAQFLEASNGRLAESSGFYSRALETILAMGQGKVTDEQKKALPDLVKALEDGQAPYSNLAETLSVTSKIAEGDMVAAEAQLSTPLPPSDPLKVAFKDPAQLTRLAVEVSKLAAARALLPNDAKRPQAIDALVSLVNDGEFIPTAALSVLQTVAPDRVQKDDLTAKLEARKPYAATVLAAQ